MTDLLRVKYENLELKQSEIAHQLRYSTCTSQRYRNDINILSPCTIQPNNTNKRTKKGLNTKFNNVPHREPDVRRL